MKQCGESNPILSGKFCTLIAGHPGDHRSMPWSMHETSGHHRLLCSASWCEPECPMRETKDMINSPSHYGGADNPYEHWKVMVALGLDRDAFLYSCTKYLWRLGRKVDPPPYNHCHGDSAETPCGMCQAMRRSVRNSVFEDLRKAAWYLQKRIEQEENRG